jgi:hypothetical protein
MPIGATHRYRRSRDGGLGSCEERLKAPDPPFSFAGTQEAAPQPGAAFLMRRWPPGVPPLSPQNRKRYARAKPIWAANIITYMWVHEGWFSVRARSSGRRTMR